MSSLCDNDLVFLRRFVICMNYNDAMAIYLVCIKTSWYPNKGSSGVYKNWLPLKDEWTQWVPHYISDCLSEIDRVRLTKSDCLSQIDLVKINE